MRRCALFPLLLALLASLLLPLPLRAAELSAEQTRAARAIARVWMDQGRRTAAEALAVAWYESQWKPAARNRICCATGLFQITRSTWERYQRRMGGGRGAAFPFSRAADPLRNAEMALFIFRSDPRNMGGWGQWSVVNEAVEAGRQAKVDLDDPLGELARRSISAGPAVAEAARSVIAEEAARRRGLAPVGGWEVPPLPDYHLPASPRIRTAPPLAGGYPPPDEHPPHTERRPPPLRPPPRVAAERVTFFP